jgi:DNA-binding MarR family transcriptional regulator
VTQGGEGVCACASVRRTGRALTQLYDNILAPSGLRSTQYALLSQLASSEPIAMTDLAEVLGMDRTTLTRAVAPLERQGWLRVEEGSDRRTRQVRATPEGLTALATARPFWQEAQGRVVAGFGEERLAALRQELAALTAITH